MRGIIELKSDKSSVGIKPCLKRHTESKASEEPRGVKNTMDYNDDYWTHRGSQMLE